MSPDITVKYLSDTCVQLTCLLGAPQERIFRAWTTPSEVARWFTPEPHATCEVSEMDLRVGGQYTMAVTTPDARHTMTGQYLALEPHHLIRFSWNSSCGSDGDGVSEVTVELAPFGSYTRLTLTHDRLAHADSRDGHAEGWTACLIGLSQYAASL